MGGPVYHKGGMVSAIRRSTLPPVDAAAGWPTPPSHPISIVVRCGGPRPRTDDMRVMLEDIERADPSIRLLQDSWDDRCVLIGEMARKILKNNLYGRMLA